MNVSPSYAGGGRIRRHEVEQSTWLQPDIPAAEASGLTREATSEAVELDQTLGCIDASLPLRLFVLLSFNEPIPPQRLNAFCLLFQVSLRSETQLIVYILRERWQQIYVWPDRTLRFLFIQLEDKHFSRSVDDQSPLTGVASFFPFV